MNLSKAFVCLIVSLFYFTQPCRAQVPLTCFEIQSILVDACGNPEGENEMVRFITGPNPLNVNNLNVTWPANAYLGICSGANTAGIVSTLNSSIQGCGFIKEPPGGIIPPGSTVILVTSTNMNPSYNSFAALQDTIYMIFQCAGNTGGHFRNYGTGVGGRTLSMTFGGGCSDAVTYYPDSLTDQNGLHAAQDGATAVFDFQGGDSYTNPGCQAPITPLQFQFATYPDSVCTGTIINLSATNVSGNYQSVFWTGGQGIFTPATGLNTSYQTSNSFTGNDIFYFGIVGLCGDTIYDTLNVFIKSGNQVSISAIGSVSICPGDSVILVANSPGSVFQWSTGSTSGSITVFAAGNYTVTATSSCGVSQATQGVTVNPAPQVSITAGGPLNFCSGDSVTLTANVNGSVVWSTGATTNSITVYNTGSYIATVMNSCGMKSDSAQVTVNTFIPVTITASGPLNFCQGGNVTLNASGFGSFLWSDGSSGNSINVNTTGIYTVTATSLCGVSNDTVSVDVSLNPSGSITVLGSNSFCQGDSVALLAAGNGNFTWSNGSSSDTIYVTNGGVYTLSVTNVCGSVSYTQSIIENLLPAAIISPAAPLFICPNDTLLLIASGGSTYTWSNGSISPATQIYNAGVYTVTATNVCGTSVSSITVTPELPPVAGITGNAFLCPGTTASLVASGGGTYQWQDGSVNDTLTASAPGLYYVIVSNSCGTDSVAVQVDGSQLNASFTANLTTGPSPLTVTFSNTSTLASGYSWNFGDGSPLLTDNDPVHVFQSDGTYTVILVASDASGCTDTATLTVIVHTDGVLFIPNVFTPNNDSVNDIFIVKGEAVNQLHGAIYNRWGRMVFSWDDISKGWNGKNDGTEAPEAVYYYVVNVRFTNGEKKNYSGTVTLLR